MIKELSGNFNQKHLACKTNKTVGKKSAPSAKYAGELKYITALIQF